MSVTLVPGLLSRSACDAFIEAAEKQGFSAMGSRYPNDYRDNDRLLLDTPSLAADLFPSLRQALPALLERKGRVYRLVGLNERFRVCRYRNGQSFSKHRDGPYLRDNGERSFLTCQVYLNEDFDGGATRFYSGEIVTHGITPRTGTAIVFDHDHWHDGEAVPRGTKYVLRTDAIYAPVRPAEQPLADAGYFWRAITLDSGLVALTSRDGCVRVVDGALNVRRTHRVCQSSLLAIAQRGDSFVVGNRDGELFVDAVRTPIHAGAVLDVLVSPGGGIVSASADGSVASWKSAGAVERHQFGAWQTALGWHDGHLYSGGADGVVRRDFEVIERHPAPVACFVGAQAILAPSTCATQTPAGVVTAGEDGCVRLGERVLTRHDDFVRAVAFSDGVIISAGYDGVRATALTPS